MFRRLGGRVGRSKRERALYPLDMSYTPPAETNMVDDEPGGVGTLNEAE